MYGHDSLYLDRSDCDSAEDDPPPRSPPRRHSRTTDIAGSTRAAGLRTGMGAMCRHSWGTPEEVILSGIKCTAISIKSVLGGRKLKGWLPVDYSPNHLSVHNPQNYFAT